MAKKLPNRVQINLRSMTIGDFKKFVDELPRAVRGVATLAVAEYLQDEFKKQDVSYPKYKWVTRANAYGNYNGHDAKGWKSAKQRRYVMARIRSGEITPGTPNRSGTIAEGWKISGEGVKARLFNAAPGAIWAHNEDTHAMQLAMVGWKPVGDLVEENLTDAIGYAADVIAARVRERLSR